MELRKRLYRVRFPGIERGGSLIAAAMTPEERSLRSKKAAMTRGMRRSLPIAMDIEQRAKTAEPEVTQIVKDIVEQNGGRTEGLEHRLKSVDSLARKIYTKAKERKQTLGQSADRISDALRYTGVIDEPPPGNYSQSIRGIIDTLRGRGMEVLEMETHWRRGDAYNGVHLIVRHPNGTKVEMQFHTTASLAAKQRTHEIYEEARLPSKSSAQRAAYVRMMVKIADTAPIPRGALNHGVRVFRPPVREAYR